MKTIFVITWANIKSKKLQSFALCAVFVAVSILFFLSVSLFGTTGAFEKLFVESKTSQSIIYVQGETSKDMIMAYLENNEEILHVSVLQNFDEIIETNITHENTQIPIPDALFTEFAVGEYDQIKMIEGKSPTELSVGEVIFSYGKSKLINVTVGDTIVVNTEQGSTQLVIAGIGIDLTYNFDTITLNRFWTTKGTIALLENGETDYSIGISYQKYSSEVEEKIMDEITMALGDRGSEIMILPHQLILQANSFFQIIMGAIFTLIAVILIVVGLFIIRSIIFNNIVTESKKIATLKSTGFSSNNIISMYLLEYGVIAMISIIIGFFGSLILSNVVLSDLNELSKLFGLSQHHTFIQVIMVFVLTLSVIELTVYLVSRSVSKINPAVALSRGTQVHESKAVVSIIQHHKMPLCFVLAIKDMIYNKKMMITLLLFILATTFTVVTLSSATYSLNTQKSNHELWLGYDIDAKIVTSSPMDYAEYQDIISMLHSSDKVLGTVSLYNDFNSQIYDESEEKFITAISQIFVTDDQEVIRFNVLNGRLPENENEIMLANNLLVSVNKEIGDYVTIRSLGEERELLIVGECQSLTNQGMTFRLFFDDMREEFLNHSLIQVKFVADEDDMVLMSEITNLFGSNTTLVFEETNASMVSMMGILSLVTTGVIGIFSVICLVVLLNLNITNINKERFNYGIYKSIGMNNRNIMNIYLLKNSMVNIVGIILGSVLSILVVPSILNAMMASLGITKFPTIINYQSILLSIVIVFLVTFVNAFFIQRNVSTITPKDLLIE
ncbi:MAG: ABC transporter permease [Bacilli bacterium]|nr:ABC transporter permease [Bacilli bacterium]